MMSNHRQLMQLAWHINHRTCCFYVLSLCDKTPLKTLIARGRDGEKCRGSDYLKGDHSQNPEIYFRPTFLNYFASFSAKMKIIFEVDNFNIFCQRLVYLYIQGFYKHLNEVKCIFMYLYKLEIVSLNDF